MGGWGEPYRSSYVELDRKYGEAMDMIVMLRRQLAHAKTALTVAGKHDDARRIQMFLDDPLGQGTQLDRFDLHPKPIWTP